MKYFGILFTIFVCVVQSAFCQLSQLDKLSEDLKQLEGQAFYSKSNELALLYLGFNAEKSSQICFDIINSKIDDKFPQELSQAHYINGRAQTILGNYQSAYSELEIAQNSFKSLGLKKSEANVITAISITKMTEGKYQEAQSTITQAINILSAVDPKGNDLANAYQQLGKNYGYLGDYKQAQTYLEKAQDIHKKLNNAVEESEDVYRLGINYYDQSDEEKALEYFALAKSLKEKANDFTGLARVNNSLGVLHSEKGNYETSIAYYQESVKAQQKVGDRQGEAITLNNLGIAYLDWGKLDSAYVYHNKSLKINQDIGYNIGIIRSLSNIGEVYQFKKEYPSAIKNYLEAKTLSNKFNDKPLMRLISFKLGEIYLSQKKLDSAEYYLKLSEEIRTKQNNYFGLRNTYKNLSALYEERQDFSKALAYHKLYMQVQDSFTSTRATEKLARIQAMFDTERQEKEIVQLQKENDRKTLWQNILGISTFLAIVIGILIFRFFKYRNQKNKELLEVKEVQRQQLEQLDKTKTRFFNNISHELRTPLTLILGPLSELKESVDVSKKSMVDMIQRNGERLLKLINQMLDLSKLESGNLQLKASHIDIVPELKKWTSSFQSLADVNNIKLNFGADSTSCFLYADIEKLEDMVLNLLSNAIKYTPEKGIITLSLKKELYQEKEMMCIQVSDTGKGIVPQELDRVFDRFYQASNAKSENVSGTGIGLSLVKELTELHKGKVTAESIVGKGSTFKIFLPLGKEHLTEDQIKITLSEYQKEDTLHEVSKTADVISENLETENTELPLVLVIEDNTDLRSFIKLILNDNFNVIEAIDGENGIQQAIETIPDIIISDVMMPKKDGFQVCKALKNDLKTSHIPIVLLTARSTKEDKLEGFKQLADEYLTKPFDKEELLARVDNLLQSRKKLQEHFGTGALLRPDKISLSSMDVDFMETIKKSVEEEISNSNFGVVELAEKVHLSRSQLFRKIKAITNVTPNEYIRSFRLQRAMDMLQQQSGTVSEIAYQVGFQNVSYFSKCFHDQFGQPPTAFSK